MKREPFEIPDSECERATRNEMSSIRMLLIFTSNIVYGREDLVKRLKIIPNGMERINSLYEDSELLLQDLLGTISNAQRRKLRNDANDYDIKLTPKFSTDRTSMAVTQDELKTLIDAAREKCKFCTLDGKECVKCELYKLLLGIVPLDDYGSEIVCPYAYQEWIN